MDNHTFNVESEKVRKLCDPMSARQIDDLIELLRSDAIDKDRAADPLSPDFGKSKRSAP